MANEKKTEALTKKMLIGKGYTEENGFLLEEQMSDNPKIKKLLLNASKSGNGQGKPEFIISNSENEVVIVVECKASVTSHKTEDLSNPKDYACDGAVHYASYLSKEYDVIAIGVSGETDKELVIDTYSWLKGDVLYKDMNLNEIRTMDEYCNILNNSPEKVKLHVSELMDYAKDLHNQMRDYAKLSENEKPLLVSAILIALQHKSFERSYKIFDDAEIAEQLFESVEKVLKKSKIPEDKRKNLMSVWSFILAKEEFKKKDKFLGINPLKHIIDGIDIHVRPFVSAEHSIDIIGKFYGEFLRYTGGDGKGLGIVLTPNHIADLFSELADVSVNTVVLDTCTGTAGLLISAMKRMIDKANGDFETIEKIKKNNLVGVEQQPHMYALACSNMILRGDGKANLFMGSCFDQTHQLKSKKPTVGLINPPYSQKGEGLSELDFIEHMLDCLQPGGLGFAIVPMSCAVDTKKSAVAIKKRILSKHSLEAVMSMPDDLFYPVGAITCIIVFKAHIPHDSDIESWFGYWKNDGFVKTKRDGRVDVNNTWDSIRSEWVKMFKNRKEIVGKSVKRSVTENDEWCAEAYMETDYSKLTRDMFEKDIKEYMLFKLMSEGNSN